MKKILLLLAVFTGFVTHAQFLEKKKDLKKYEGFFDFYYSQKEDKIFLEVSDLNKEFLYVYSLSSGVGSNDIGLDRGQLGNEQVVKFQRAGNKLLLVQPNLDYRAITDNELERRSVEQAFAKSVLYGFKIEEEKNGKFVIDITSFLLQDAHGVKRRLAQQNQGNYSVDASKSALAMERTKAFPKNVEFEALLTFKGEARGGNIRSVTPNPNLVSVIEHHSFIELPDANYEKRIFDPRSGAISISYLDYATPVFEPIRKRYIIRHRLEKKDPNAAVSEAKEPIVYYLDNGTPEPIRSALLEGGKWWNQAFEAIGFKDAFQVKILPDDADPMDVRYNVIQWVHRSTRGWSYGGSVIDPRTGEILKGHVSLGSLRIRQDFLIAQALMNKPFAERDDNYQPMLELALARIRQLSAHEIGHTIGFAHNFAASVSGRASVMDYPHPQFSVNNGEIDFSNAYDTGIGEWDKVTVAYSYSQFPQGTNERNALNAILAKAGQDGLRFISDSDARPRGGAHALAHLWDNGADAVNELENVLEVRKTAISNFSKDNIRTNEPYSVLEDVFVPLYFFHRYQTEAAVKLIGGLDYNYAVKGDGQQITKVVDSKEQKKALDGLLNTLSTEVLIIPEDKLALFPPRAMGYGRSRESFRSKAGVAFDPVSAASTASDMTLGLLLHPQRATRLIQQKAIDKRQLGLEEVLDELISNTIKAKAQSGYEGEIQRAVNYSVLRHIINLSAGEQGPSQLKAITDYKLAELRDWLKTRTGDASAALMSSEIDKFLKNPKGFKNTPAPQIPDGSPIGMPACDFNGF
ncbi:DUF5117 domain-containing protein [Leptobacterium flavescens]|uniref:DUF5117 domain-containing protein n=1 Tax=Leptobacterium flavescens TaxID=472055 RepID=A0A6P0USK1_9FLAO|nr:zinc-dependent metalloprotease [Leptobacterium flavescens]NER13843.1 DUF5117 domain-containing protein [Leptobacterium flavescens]